MHTHRCVLIEISMEIGMLNFRLGLLVTALMKETYFIKKVSTKIHQKCPRKFTYFVHEYSPFMSTRSLPPSVAAMIDVYMKECGE